MDRSQPLTSDEPLCARCGLYDAGDHSLRINVVVGFWGTDAACVAITLCEYCVKDEIEAILSRCSEFGRWQWVERLRATRAAAEQGRAAVQAAAEATTRSE